jgi:hypothetical protein
MVIVTHRLGEVLPQYPVTGNESRRRERKARHLISQSTRTSVRCALHPHVRIVVLVVFNERAKQVPGLITSCDWVVRNATASSTTSTPDLSFGADNID